LVFAKKAVTGFFASAAPAYALQQVKKASSKALPYFFIFNCVLLQHLSVPSIKKHI
jgi:hypothetical protein